MAGFGTNTTADIDNAVRPMLAESKYTVENKPVMGVKGVCTVVRLKPGEGDKYRYPKYGTLPDAEDLTEGEELTTTHKLSDTIAEIEPTEVGLRVALTDKLRRQVRDDMLKLAGKQIGDSGARKQDKDGIAMFSGFSVGIGSAGTALTWEHLAAARTAIFSNTEPADTSVPIYGVFRSEQLHPLAKDLAPAGTYPIPSGLSEEVIKAGRVKANGIAGIDMLFEDNNISKDSSDDAIGAVFSKDALILVQDAMPALETERKMGLRGVVVQQTWNYAFGEYLDGWGRSMTFDSVTPTS
jgi:hypothetical protein